MTLGNAIRMAIKQSPYRTQVPFADVMGVDQTTVSKWCRGETALTVEQVRRIEDECSLPRGQVLVWAGYVDVTTVVAAVDDYALAADQQQGPIERGPRVTRPSPPAEPEGP